MYGMMGMWLISAIDGNAFDKIPTKFLLLLICLANFTLGHQNSWQFVVRTCIECMSDKCIVQDTAYCQNDPNDNDTKLYPWRHCPISLCLSQRRCYRLFNCFWGEGAKSQSLSFLFKKNALIQSITWQQRSLRRVEGLYQKLPMIIYYSRVRNLRNLRNYTVKLVLVTPYGRKKKGESVRARAPFFVWFLWLWLDVLLSSFVVLSSIVSSILVVCLKIHHFQTLLRVTPRVFESVQILPVDCASSSIIIAS